MLMHVLHCPECQGIDLVPHGLSPPEPTCLWHGMTEGCSGQPDLTLHTAGCHVLLEIRSDLISGMGFILQAYIWWVFPWSYRTEAALTLPQVSILLACAGFMAGRGG
jgi:hypothetical protein